MKSKREIIKEKRRRKALLTRLAWGTALLAGIALVVYLFFNPIRPSPSSAADSPASSSGDPAIGEAVAVMPDSSHVPEGTDPGPYTTDPPTSGRHYAATLDPGFYNEGNVQTAYPEGHLVHNLEHGYVIFWYNCSLLDEAACNELKSQVQDVMQAEDNFKVIAFPWESIDVPVVMTSWGRRLPFETFDTELARDFVIRNRNKAPEPNAP